MTHFQSLVIPRAYPRCRQKCASLLLWSRRSGFLGKFWDYADSLDQIPTSYSGMYYYAGETGVR